MATKMFQLPDGREIIAKATSTGSSMYVLDDPMIVAVMPGNIEGKIGLQLLPLTFACKSARVEINADRLVISPYDPDPEFEKQYLSQVSGIALA